MMMMASSSTRKPVSVYTRSCSYLMILLATTATVVVLADRKHAFNPDSVKLNVRNNADVALDLSWINVYGNNDLVPQKADAILPYTQMGVDSFRGHSFVMTDHKLYPDPKEIIFDPNNFNRTEMVTFTMSEFDDEVYISRSEQDGSLEAETVNSYTRTTAMLAQAQEICSQTCSEDGVAAVGVEVTAAGEAAAADVERTDSAFVTCVLDVMSKMYDTMADELTRTLGLLSKASDRVHGYVCKSIEGFKLEVERSYSWRERAGAEVKHVDVLMEDPTAQIARVRDFASKDECAALISAAESVGMKRKTNDPALKALTAEVPIPPNLTAGATNIPGASVFERSYALINHALGVTLPREGQENFQVMKFEAGMDDEYHPHCDGPCNGEALADNDRVATVWIYCQAPEEGGGGVTSYNAANITMNMEEGSAMMVTYVNKKPFRRTDLGKTRHGECPVSSGSKTVIALSMKLNPLAAANTANSDGDSDDDDDDGDSVVGSNDVGLTIQNTLEEPMVLYWLHVPEKYLSYIGDIPPNGGKMTANSFVGHSFAIIPASLGDQNLAPYFPGPKIGSLLLRKGGDQTHLVTQNADGALRVSPAPAVANPAKLAAANSTSLHGAVDTVCGSIKKAGAGAAFTVAEYRAQYLSCLEQTALTLNTVKDKQVAVVRMVLEEAGDLARNLTCVDPTMSSTKNDPIREFNFVFDKDISHTNPPPMLEDEIVLGVEPYDDEEKTTGLPQVSPVKVLYEDHAARVMVLDNFISNRECDNLIKGAQSSGMARAQVSGGVGVGNSVTSETRRADAGGVRPDLGPDAPRTPTSDVYKRGYAFANNITGYNMDYDGQEGFSVIHYNPTDEYRPHCDGDCTGTPYRPGGRVSTMVIYCGEPELGGATSFNNIDIYVKGKKGQAAFFSYLDTNTMKTDNAKTRHSGCPILKGNKWIATLWMRLGVTEAVGYDNWDPEGNPKNERARRISAAAEVGGIAGRADVLKSIITQHGREELSRELEGGEEGSEVVDTPLPEKVSGGEVIIDSGVGVSGTLKGMLEGVLSRVKS